MDLSDAEKWRAFSLCSICVGFLIQFSAVLITEELCSKLMAMGVLFSCGSRFKFELKNVTDSLCFIFKLAFVVLLFLFLRVCLIGFVFCPGLFCLLIVLKV
jgi:hypothetical protein